MRVAEILLQRGRKWQRREPASDADVSLLLSQARAELPFEYLELLRFSNGGEGPLSLRPLWFQLYAINDCVNLCHSGWVLKEFPDLMFFGSNGGMESIAFDLHVGLPPWPIVTVDEIAGVSSAERIASDMAEFVEAIGIERGRLTR